MLPSQQSQHTNLEDGLLLRVFVSMTRKDIKARLA